MSAGTLQVILIGADGSRWHLYDAKHVTQGMEGISCGPITGLRLPPWTQVRTQAAQIPGSTYRATKYDSPKLALRLDVGVGPLLDCGGDRWRTLDAALTAALSAEQTQRLMVISNRGYRWWDCRLDELGVASADEDPGKQSFASYNAVWVPDDAFAHSFPHTQRIPAGGTATVPNAGEVTGWPIFTVDGPVTGTSVPTVGSGTQLTTLPPLTQGQRVVFDSDPSRRTVVDAAGNDRRPEIAGVDRRAPIQPGSTRVYGCTFTGEPPSAVTITVPLRFRAAW